jgi:DNA-binding MarR family transcriptional regulator
LNADGPVTQRQHAGHAVTDAMTSQVLGALEERGLVERAEHPSDRRARAVVVGAAGAKLANRANGAVEGCDSKPLRPARATRRLVRHRATHPS